MDDLTVQTLIIVLIGAVISLLILIAVYMGIKYNSKKEKKEKKEKKVDDNNIATEGGKQSIFKFLEFDKIEDNMIIQNDGKKFIMAIECQGVNYDLMSGVEKTGVEEGFVQFLNTLRNPIQIYIQTRTINLESSLNNYKSRVNQIESKLMSMRQRYNEMLESNAYSKEELEKVFFELTKQNNLYEYGKDVIKDTERMSLNRNILNKKYYIIISYYASELGNTEVDKTELLSIAFSELYTRAQSIIRAISPCGVNGKVLNSLELAELLYVAYNRDESEVFDLKKAIRGNFDSLYRTAPDVLEKRIKELDKVIEQKAMNKVTEGVEKYRTRSREKLEQKEESIEELADELAKIILEENRTYLGDDLIEELLKEAEEAEEAEAKTKAKGGKKK